MYIQMVLPRSLWLTCLDPQGALEFPYMGTLHSKSS
jgi:hypothetical protein